MDLEGTRRATQPAFCGFDWKSFDSETFSWGFEGESYVERLKDIGPSPGPELASSEAADTK